MLGLIQRVTYAEVCVEGISVGSIKQGILALIGIEKTDTEQEARKLLERMINYRIFTDKEGKSNLSLKDIQGELLLVPQFTLVADTQKGTRPGFSTGMAPDEGKRLFEYLLSYGKKDYPRIASGQFGADMQVTLCNDGPTTFMLQTKNKQA